MKKISQIIDYAIKNPKRALRRPLRNFRVLIKLIFKKRLGIPEKVLINGKSFYVDYSVIWEAINEKKWENETFEVLSKYLDKNHSYIDIGAWIGPTVLYASKFAKHCHAIEPDYVAYKELNKNLSLNKECARKITLHKVCINNKNGPVKLGAKHFGDSYTSMVRKGLKNYVEVPGIRFKDFLSKNKIKDYNFIKIDIEGGEAVVLPDMKPILKKDLPILYLSLHPDYFEEGLESSIRKILDSIKHYNNFYYRGKKITLRELKQKLLNKEHFEILIKK